MANQTPESLSQNFKNPVTHEFTKSSVSIPDDVTPYENSFQGADFENQISTAVQADKNQAADFANITSRTATNEEQVRQVLEDFEDAFETKDLNALMALYSENVIVFDEAEELVYDGKLEYQKIWERCFAKSEKLELKVREMKVFVDQNVAFVHYLCHVFGNDISGQSVEHWSRCTVGFLKENGRWMISHEHNSVPFDLSTGEALLDAEPAPILTQ